MRALAFALAALGLAGCHSNPYCLSCGEQPLTSVDAAGQDLTGAPLDGMSMPALDGPCAPTNGGVEICDGLDNDCNGTVDDVDPANLTADPNNCGACGNVCNFVTTHQFGSCAVDATGAAACTATTCMPGFVDLDPAQPGCEYRCTPTVPPAEICDGRDNDCDGTVDNATPPADLCSTKGVCAGQTIPTVCMGAAGWRCDYSKVPDIALDAAGKLAVIETVCDGKDNNCNGVVDLDGFPKVGDACTAGVGACQTAGTVACTSTTSTGCGAVPNPGAATDEKCNGIDDNCDGNIDERTPAVVTLCPNGSGGMRACFGYVDPMVAIPKPGGTPGQKTYVYRYEASRPDSTGSSPGGDSNRACAKAGAIPWANVTQAQAEAACDAVVDSTGTGHLRLCTDDEWRVACEGPGGPPVSPATQWSLSTAPGTYVEKVCNDGRLAMSHAVWATGTTGSGSGPSGPYCYTDWDTPNNQRLYDMSGNLMEWTSTTVTSQGNTYYQLHGGSFSNPRDGTSCEFTFDIAPASFFDANVGFRCCGAAPP